MNKHVLAAAMGAIFAHPMSATAGTDAPGAPSTPPAPTPAGANAPVDPKPAKKNKGKAKKKSSGKSGANDELTGPAVLKKYAPQYQKGGADGKAKTTGGNKTVDCGDKMADLLRGKTLDEVYAEAVKVLNTALEEGQEKVTLKSLQDKYGKLNFGMQRMNLGNRMRAILFPKAAAATPKKEKVTKPAKAAPPAATAPEAPKPASLGGNK